MHIYLLVELHDSKNTALQDANASHSNKKVVFKTCI